MKLQILKEHLLKQQQIQPKITGNQKEMYVHLTKLSVSYLWHPVSTCYFG